jgi:hypothetical protein
MVPKGWSISALAVELDRDRRTIAAACADLTPIGKDGRSAFYRLTDVLEKLSPAKAPVDADDARTRKLAAEAEIAEMQRDKMRGELVDISSVESVVAEEYAAVRSKLLALPGKLAPMVAIEADEIACRDLIERGVTEALDELARDAGEIAAGIEAATANDTPSGAESTAATDRQ